MTWWELMGIAVGLGMDAFAVSIAVGSKLERLSFRPVFRLSFHFGLFQFLMPVIGWLIGWQLSELIGSVDHWIAFVSLTALGAKMIWESRGEEAKELASDPTRKWSLVILSVATSIDALVVGFSIALLNVSIITACTVIGVTAAAMTLVGMFFGRQIGLRLGHYAGIAGGLILCAIGAKILIEHL